MIACFPRHPSLRVDLGEAPLARRSRLLPHDGIFEAVERGSYGLDKGVLHLFSFKSSNDSLSILKTLFGHHVCRCEVVDLSSGIDDVCSRVLESCCGVLSFVFKASDRVPRALMCLTAAKCLLVAAV